MTKNSEFTKWAIWFVILHYYEHSLPLATSRTEKFNVTGTVCSSNLCLIFKILRLSNASSIITAFPFMSSDKAILRKFVSALICATCHSLVLDTKAIYSALRLHINKKSRSSFKTASTMLESAGAYAMG